MNALLIGCGKIGALYDYHTDEVLTHAKAYHSFGFDVDFVEPKDEIAHMIINKYGFQRKEYSVLDLKKYNFISISTPTEYHTEYLIDAIKAEIPMVICEKPIAYTIEELEVLMKEYEKGKSKIIVNYLRRFQSRYASLKKRISNFNEPLQSVHCNYYKGIMNYGGHALDTIYFLTSFEVENRDVLELRRHYDYFDKDPTISFFGCKGDTEFCFRGLTVDYPVFEIDLIFESYRVTLTKNGANVSIYKRNELLFNKFNMTKNYMTEVLKHSQEVYFKKKMVDNFKESVALNKTLIEIIN